MFDIGFWELVLISVIGLVVLGPERLPVAIRTVRGWIASVRGFSNNIKTELTEELRIHELHSNLKKAEQQNMQNLTAEMSDSVKSLQEAAAMVTRPYEKDSKDDKASAEISSVPSTTPKDEKPTE